MTARLALIFLAFFAWSLPAGAPAQDACALHIPWGLLTVTDGAQIQLACHDGYLSGVDPARKEARWVAYRLTAAHDLGCFPRKGLTFKPDALLAASAQGKRADYAHSPYDLGHMAPNEDFAWSQSEQKSTFSMLNVEPQLPGLNRQGWERLEEDVRAWARTRQALIVYVGPIYEKSTPLIGADKLLVPSAFFKVVVDPTTKQVMGFIMPQKAIRKGSPVPWRALLSDIQSRAAITLALPSGYEEVANASTWPADLKGWRRAHTAACKHS